MCPTTSSRSPRRTAASTMSSSLAARTCRTKRSKWACQRCRRSSACRRQAELARAGVSETGDEVLWPARHHRDGPASVLYGGAMKAIGLVGRQECGRWLNNRAENSHQPFRRREVQWRNSELSGRSRNLPLFTPRSKTTFIRTATSTAVPSSGRNARSLWPSGVIWQPKISGSGRFGDLFALD